MNDHGAITALEPSARRPGRYDLWVDGSPVATLSVEAIARLGLVVGRPFDGALVEQVAEESRALAAFDRAVRILARRGRAAQELRRMLLRKGESAPLVERALAQLAALGLLDDAAFAEQFARSRLARGEATQRVRAELARRGVDAAVREAAIARVLAEDAVDAASLMERLARRKLRGLRGEEPAVRRRRLYAFLARRGYDADDVRRVVERLIAESERDAPA